VLRVKSVVFAAVGVAVALVFFPRWFGVPVAVVLAAWNLSLTVRAATVVLDPGAGLLVLRVGLITRRIRLTDITAVLVDQAKVSIARSAGGEISLYAWRKSHADAWLRVPVVASDIGHAVASAVALAQDAARATAQDASVTATAATAPAAGRDTDRAGTPGVNRAPAPTRSGTSARARSALATALLGCVGVVALAAAFLVKLSWHNPVMTVLSVILALALGVSGLFYVMFALWLRLPKRSSTPRPDPA
jgi:hypothetical protein